MQAGDLLRLSFDYGTTKNNGNVLRRQGIPSRPREGLRNGCGCHQNLARPGFSVTQTYTYDAYNRIQKVEEGSNHRDFQYKEPGNMYVPSSQRTGWAPGSFTPTSPSWFDEKNRLVTPLLRTQYDAAGNLTAIGGFTFEYDAENRRVSSTLNSVTTTYAYDGEGRRVKKGSAVMVYDAFGRLAADYGGTADPVGTEYLTADHLGSTRLVTSSTGAERRCLDYLPFGEQMTQGMGTRGSCYASSTEPRVKFTGKERNAESGLNYVFARYYSAAQGRFTSPDEFQGGIVDPFTEQQVGAPGPLPYADITDPQTLNKYAYVRNNPLRYVDPDGHCHFYIGALLGGVVAGGVEFAKQLYTTYRCGQSLHFDGQKILVKTANGAIFGGTVAATGGLRLAGTTQAYNTTASMVGGAVERSIDADSDAVVLAEKAITADVLTGAATGLVGGGAKELAKGAIAAGSRQATSRAESLLRQAVESGDPARIAKREAQAQAVQSSVNRHAVAASAAQRTAVKTAVGTVLKPEEQR